MPTATMSYGKLVRHTMAPVLLVLAVLGAFAPALFAARDPGEESKTQKHENRREIDQLELAWRDAVMKADVAAMDKLLAISPKDWSSETEAVGKFFETFGTRMPDEMWAQQKMLLKRLMGS